MFWQKIRQINYAKQALISLLAVLTVMFLGFTYALWVNDKQHNVALSKGIAKDALLGVESGLARYGAEIPKNILTLANSALLGSAMKANSVDINLVDYIKGVAGAVNPSDVYLISKDGKVLWSQGNAKLIGASVAELSIDSPINRGYIRAVNNYQGQNVFYSSFSNENGKVIFYTSSAVVDPAGALVGAVLYELPFESLLLALGKVPLVENFGGGLIFYDAKSQLILSSQGLDSQVSEADINLLMTASAGNSYAMTDNDDMQLHVANFNFIGGNISVAAVVNLKQLPHDNHNIVAISITALTFVLCCGLAVLLYKLVFNEYLQVMARVSEAECNAADEASNDSTKIANLISSYDFAVSQKRMMEESMAIQQRNRLEANNKIRGLLQSMENTTDKTMANIIQLARGLQDNTEFLLGIIANSIGKSHNADSASAEAADNVRVVAGAAEEMAKSVEEIATQITKAKKSVDQTVTKARNADKETKNLSKASEEIGNVVLFIQNIAEQINLLALNATIESARAGEAGSGFAVVASEIKNLAQQTTDATKTISDKILNVQEISERVVNVLQSITESIMGVNESTIGIASAIEEQTAVTNQISTNMFNAAHSVSSINDNIAGLAEDISKTEVSTKDIISALRNLLQESIRLNDQLQKMLGEIHL